MDNIPLGLYPTRSWWFRKGLRVLRTYEEGLSFLRAELTHTVPIGPFHCKLRPTRGEVSRSPASAHGRLPHY